MLIVIRLKNIEKMFYITKCSYVDFKMGQRSSSAIIGALLQTVFFFLSSNSKVFLNSKLEDLKVLRRSPDLLNNDKISQGQLQLIMKQILFYRIFGLQPFWSSDLNNPMNTPSNSPVISEEKMFR